MLNTNYYEFLRCRFCNNLDGYITTTSGNRYLISQHLPNLANYTLADCELHLTEGEIISDTTYTYTDKDSVIDYISRDVSIVENDGHMYIKFSVTASARSGYHVGVDRVVLSLYNSSLSSQAIMLAIIEVPAITLVSTQMTYEYIIQLE